jgi:8-oxo-dGTP pyrophosphatase MutT (NUDIX family)
VRILGCDAEGRTVFSAPLPHGGSPDAVAFDAGYVSLGPVGAARAADGVLELTLRVRSRSGEKRPRVRKAGRDQNLPADLDARPRRRQRVAAYALVTSERGILATQYSSRTAVDGRWGMPGGGLDEDEEPVAAVVREVYEETAQSVVLAALETVQTSHWVGRNPRGELEDFHAVRLVYLAECPDPTEPRVLDADGTTADARWVPVADWASLDWTPGWRQILTDRYGGP